MDDSSSSALGPSAVAAAAENAEPQKELMVINRPAAAVAKRKRSFGARLFPQLLDRPKDTHELVDVLRGARQDKVINSDALEMIEGVLSVSSMQVRDIMIPRAHMIVINKDHKPNEFLPEVLASGHSRFPVIKDSRDDVKGILLAKDLLRIVAEPDFEFKISSFLRPVAYVPESKRLNVLLREFRLSRNHMAIVVDEYGGVSGLVTIEDVLEQIVGEIDDEHDADDEKFIMRRGPNNYAVKALTPIDDFNERFGTNLLDGEFDTVGGLVMNALGRLPRRGETVEMENLQFRVVRVDSRRIHMLQVRPVTAENGEDA